MAVQTKLDPPKHSFNFHEGISGTFSSYQTR